MWIKKPEFIFLIFAFIFGLLFMFITPYDKVPDERAHLLRACEVADGIFYNKTPAQNVACDNYLHKDLNFERAKVPHQVTGYPPTLYVFSALGFKVGQIWGGHVMFYLGRIFNFLAWLVLTALAIRITPVFKWMFLFTALLPMSLYEGMSLSADSFNNAFAFLFFAYIFKLIFEKKELARKDYILLFVMSILSAFTKGAIYPIFLFIFLPLKKYKYLFAAVCFSVAFILMSYWASVNLPFINSFADPEYHKYLLLHNPLDFVREYILAVVIKINFYIRSCIGIFGWLDVRLNNWIYTLTSIVFFSLFIFLPEKKVSNIQRIFALIVLFLFMTMMHAILYITWTPPEFNKVAGFQGRYLISVLPYVFLLLAQSNHYVSKKFQRNYKTFILIYMFLILALSCARLLQEYHPAVYYFYMFK